MKTLFQLLSNSFSLLCALLVFGAAVQPVSLSAQSLWSADSRSLFADKRGTKVGDILTIVIQENNSATKDQSTKTARKSSADASISSFLYGPEAMKFLTKGGKFPSMNFGASSDFNGGGQIANSEKITARIAVRIIDVLPNRNLIVEGSRKTAFSGETQDAILRGVVREDDVQANNTVFSYNLADATIKYVSSGAVSNVQKKGWFTSIWDKVAPF